MMKNKYRERILAIVLMIMLTVNSFCVPVYAETVTISAGAGTEKTPETGKEAEVSNDNTESISDNSGPDVGKGAH